MCIDDEIPFEIPNGWRWARLGCVFELRSGQDFPPEKYNDKSIGTPYITGASNIDGNVIIQNRWTEYPSVIAPEGCLLLVCKGSGVGKMCYMNIPKAHIARQIQAIIPFTTNILIDFLRFAIECRLIEITSQANGVIPGISREATLSFLLPIPPLKEQIRIVEKLKGIEPLVSNYEICESKLKHINSEIFSSFRKSILQEAIKGSLVKQDPNEEPAFVLLQRIKEEKLRLVKEGKLKKKDVIDSTIFRGDDNKYYEQVDGDTIQIESDYTFPDTWEVVKLAHICRLMDGEKKEGNYVCLDAKYLRGKSSGDILPKGKFVSTGDNIILVDGENSGEVFAVPHDGYMGSTFKQLWVSRNMYLPFVLYFIQFYKDLLRNSKKGAAIPHLNKEIFYSLVVGIPPFQEQERIAEQIEEIMDKIKV